MFFVKQLSIMTVKIKQTLENYRKRKYHISFPSVSRTSKDSTPKTKKKKVNFLYKILVLYFFHNIWRYQLQPSQSLNPPNHQLQQAQPVQWEHLSAYLLLCAMRGKVGLIYNTKTISNFFQFSGLMVVQLNWRGKTYYGTLLDTQKSHW